MALFQKCTRVVELVLRKGVSDVSKRCFGSKTFTDGSMGFPSGNDVGAVLTPANEVPLTELILVNGDASVAKMFSSGIIGRLNQTGELLFWRRIVINPDEKRSPGDSTYYESLTTKNALDTLREYGYINHHVKLINDNEVTVNTINDPEMNRQKHIDEVIHKIHQGLTPNIQVIHKLQPIQGSVDLLAKSGQPEQIKYHLNHVLGLRKKESKAFPFQEEDFIQLKKNLPSKNKQRG